MALFCCAPALFRGTNSFTAGLERRHLPCHFKDQRRSAVAGTRENCFHLSVNGLFTIVVGLRHDTASGLLAAREDYGFDRGQSCGRDMKSFFCEVRFPLAETGWHSGCSSHTGGKTHM